MTEGPTRRAVDPDTRLRLALPEAAPDDYLAWTAWWREIETLMLERPGLEVKASEDAAPFLRGELARLMSDLAYEVTKQATDGLMRAHDRMQVVLEFPGTAKDLLAMASYMERRGAWVAQFSQAIGIEPLSDRVEALRQLTITTLRQAGEKLAPSV
jgi:hypothetical protein